MCKYYIILFLSLYISPDILAQKFSLLGEWEGVSPKQETIVYKFNQDSSMVWTIIPPNNPVQTKKSISAKYLLNLSLDPITITIYDFHEPFLKQMNVKFEGTIKLNTDGSIEMNGKQIITQNGESKNLKYFDQPPIVLKKIK